MIERNRVATISFNGAHEPWVFISGIIMVIAKTNIWRAILHMDMRLEAGMTQIVYN